MGVFPPNIRLKLLVVIVLLNGLIVAETKYERQIRRSKRDLEENQFVGDALYDTPELNKREEIPVPSQERDKVINKTIDSDDDDDSESDVVKSNSKLAGSKTKDTESESEDDEIETKKKSDDHPEVVLKHKNSEHNTLSKHAEKRSKRKDKKLTQARNDVITSAKEESEKEEEEAHLSQGMDSNVDHPMVDTELTKQYDERKDISNGEMLGINDVDNKRHDVTTPTLDMTANSLFKDSDSSYIENARDYYDPYFYEQEQEHDVEMNEPFLTTVKRSISMNEDPVVLTKRDGEHAVADTHDMQDGGAPSHFQVDDKSADLEINANSAGVKVKAKPASLQVVSRPGSHGQSVPYVHPPMEMYHEPMHYHRPHHHHHHHRRHHHHRPHHVHYVPESFIEPHMFDYHHHEEHHDVPHFFDIPRYGDTWGHGMGGMGGEGGWGGGYGGGGYGHGYGRSMLAMRDVTGYGRSNVESALDPRLGSSESANGFNPGIALPDSESMYMNHGLDLEERERVHEARLRQLHESTIREFADTQADKERQLDYESPSYHQYAHHTVPLARFSDGVPLSSTGLTERLPSLHESAVEAETQQLEGKAPYEHLHDASRELDRIHMSDDPGRYIPDLPTAAELKSQHAASFEKDNKGSKRSFGHFR